MKPYREQTYYELLEVDPSATMDEIRAAYDKAMRLYDAENVALYPLGDPGELETLKALLLEAMEILTEPDLRVEYDRTLGIQAGPRPPAPPAPEPSPPSSEPSPPPPDPDELDDRADQAREEADREHVTEVHVDPPAPAIEEPPPDQPEDAPEPTPRQLDDRADQARQEGDAVDAAAPEPRAPTQLVMQDLVARAEAVHSTSPRYSVSYIPHAPAPPPPPEVMEVDEAAIIPLADALTETQVGPPQDAAPAPPPPAPALVPAPTPVPTPPPLPARAPKDLTGASRIAEEEAIATAEAALAEVAHAARKGREPRTPPPGAAAPPPRPRVEVGPDTIVTGELLRQVRESKGLSLSQLADRTRITPRHLENVEADRYEALPATVYLRGILMNLARELGLDAIRVSKSYLSLVEKALGRLK